MLNRKGVFTATLLVAALPGLAMQRYEGRYDRGHESNFYRGVREGGRGGQYYEPRHAHDGYDDRYHQRYDNRYRDGYNDRYGDRGGIGPGKGAAIGGAGGAILGALLGGGLKGSLIGGAAGAGIGAVVGGTTQNHRDSRERR